MRIQVRDASWRVRDKSIIEGVDADFEPGTFTGLLGPNGSGKTTLLNLIAGVRKPATGTITADGRELRTYKGRTRARKIAMLEQHAMTNLDLSVRQVVELGRIPHRGRWPGQSEEGAGVVDSSMKVSQVTDLADRRWPTLSGGERQRTQLARALAQEPSLLLLDEPTNHLDLGHQIDFLRTVSGLGVTTIAALHDLELAAAFCDRLLVLKGGRIVAQGSVAEVMNAELLADVYGVDATVDPHPVTGRPHLIWTDVISRG